MASSTQTSGHNVVAGRKRPADTQEEAWVADEDRFVLRQAMKKAVLRVKSNRAKPIDYLAVTLRSIEQNRIGFESDDEESVQLAVNPRVVFEDLTKRDLGELRTAIDTYLVLERSKSNREYWSLMKTVCDDRLEIHTDAAPTARGISTVAPELDKILGPKTLPQLQALEKQIRTKLDSQDDIDVEYWQNLLKRLHIHKARQNLLTVSVQVENARRKESADGPDASFDEDLRLYRDRIANPDRVDMSKDSLVHALPAQHNTGHDTANGVAYQREAAKGLEDDEEVFTTEEQLPTSNELSTKDYIARKPQHFNRVQTGYDWNKYNQTHFDMDNPPPKVVQGYKFNIFYPDLIDKAKAPTYRIERTDGRKRGQLTAPAGQDETCVIRFVAGPPYHDIAFRIVDKAWDFSAKHERGFKSRFDKGILQLHFQFKKVYYRK